MKLKLLCVMLATLIGGCSTYPIRQDFQANREVCQQLLGAERETCGNDSVYNVTSPIKEPKNSKNEVQTYILEFNDQGLMNDPATAKAALSYIQEQMKSNNKPIVSLFVHGWNNNAEADNTDLMSFEHAAMALNHSQQGDARSNVVAIYVSWRGKTMPAGFSHALTFWGRKAVSEEIGRGQLANFIFELESVVKPKIKLDDKENGKLILSGHSFGASALYNAVGQELLSRFYSSLQAQKENENAEIRGVGDIVILLNPAIQALRFRGLRETVYEKAMHQPTIFANNKAPIFMMVATEDDLPVETAFPIGRTVSHFLSHDDRQGMYVYQGIDKNQEPVLASVKQAERNSIGFYAPYYTHFLLLADNIQSESGSHLYRLVNASQKVLTVPKKIIEKSSAVFNNDTVEKQPQDMIEAPENNQQEPTEKTVSQPPLNISSCFSRDIHAEFERGERTSFNWIDEALADTREDETFSTVRKTPFSEGKEVDLLKLKITNHPQSLKASQVNQWPLLQKYKKDEVLSWKRNPYWFVKAKANVMQGHSGIWNANVGCLLLSVMATETVNVEFVNKNPQPVEPDSNDAADLSHNVEQPLEHGDQQKQQQSTLKDAANQVPELEVLSLPTATGVEM